MSLEALRWIFVLGVLIHNAEEARLLPAWSGTAGRWHPRVSAIAFRFAVAVLSIVLLVCATAASLSEPGSTAAYIMAGYVLAMMINALMPHLLATLFARRYMPGTATGLLLNLPLGAAYTYKALSTGNIEWSVFAWSGPLTAAVLLLLVPILIFVGRTMFRCRNGS